MSLCSSCIRNLHFFHHISELLHDLGKLHLRLNKLAKVTSGTYINPNAETMRNKKLNLVSLYKNCSVPSSKNAVSAFQISWNLLSFTLKDSCRS